MTAPFRLPLRKRIFAHPLFQDISTWLFAGLLKLCWPTYRIQREYHPEALDFMTGQRQAIFCFWHGRMIIFPNIRPGNRPMHVLISHHRDGQLIAKVIGHFGVHSVRGSSSRGALTATRSLAEMLKKGHNISITPDGPRGPLQQAQKGSVTLARLAQQPMVPVSFSASPSCRLSSWDRFMIPLPFSRVVILVGAPILPDVMAEKSGMEACRKQLEDRMNELTAEADRRLGIA